MRKAGSMMNMQSAPHIFPSLQLHKCNLLPMQNLQSLQSRRSN